MFEYEMFKMLEMLEMLKVSEKIVPDYLI